MIETLYKTKTPAVTAWPVECFEMTMGEETVDGRLGYFVRETHCWWDEAAKRALRVQYTLSPRGGFGTVEEARERYQLQRTNRARRGFMHSFSPRFEASKRCAYVRVEITTTQPASAEPESVIPENPAS